MTRQVTRVVGAIALLGAWPIAARVIDRGLPVGIVTIGVVLGAISVLPALGVALVYRATGIVNLAQGQLGTVGMLVALAVRNRWALPWLPSVAAGLAAAALVGAAAHLTLLRRLRHATTTVSVIATVGVAELVGGGTRLLAPALTHRGDPAFTGPVGGRWSVFPAVITGDHVLAVAAALATTAALAFAMTRTRWGRAVRAVAANRQRAFGLGVPVDAVLTVTWAIAAALGAAALLLQAPLFRFTGAEAVIGGSTALLLRALAAAAIGRMSLPATAVAAVVLGVVEQAAVWATGDAAIADVVLVVIIVVALLAPGRTIPVASDVADAPAVFELRASSKRALATFGVIIGVAFGAFASADKLVGAGTIVVFALVAVSVVVVSGWAGHLSLGQFGVAGLGGAVTSVVFGRYGVDVFVALGAGAATGAVAMIVIGLPAARRRGPALTLTSLAFAYAGASFFLQSRHVPWLVETDLPAPVLWGRIALAGDRAMFLFSLAVLTAAVVAVGNLERRRFGRITVAVRDNPDATAMAGVDVARARLLAFAAAGAIAGLAGGLAVIHGHGLRAETFVPAASVSVVAIAAIGGLGSVPGAVIAAVTIKSLDLLLPGDWSLLATGTGVLGFLLWFPDGVGALLVRAERAFDPRPRAVPVVAEVTV